MACVSDNIIRLGDRYYPTLRSCTHTLYDKDTRGFILETGRETANVDTYERQGLGTTGISKTSQTFRNQPYTINTEVDKNNVSRFEAIVFNQNPQDAESETSGAEIVSAGGAIALTSKFDVVMNILGVNNTNFVASSVLIDCQQNAPNPTTPMTGSPAFSVSGLADRQYDTNKPAMLEGWGRSNTVTPQTVPDDTVQVSAGAIWLRRDDSALTGTPRRCYYAGGTPIAAAVIGAVTANSRYTSIIAYENSKDGYTDILWTTLDGAEAATPVKPTQTEIETAVDALSSGARWCEVSVILVDETTTVVINTADIIDPVLPSNVFTMYQTGTAISDTMKTDSYLVFDYAVNLKLDGTSQKNLANVTNQSSTTITFGSPNPTMIEIIYYTEPLAKFDPLSA
jgi:hypothetical protein